MLNTKRLFGSILFIYRTVFRSKAEVLKEMEFLQTLISQKEFTDLCEMVFCHGDTQPANMVHNPKTSNQYHFIILDSITWIMRWYFHQHMWNKSDLFSLLMFQTLSKFWIMIWAAISAYLWTLLICTYSVSLFCTISPLSRWS